MHASQAASTDTESNPSAFLWLLERRASWENRRTTGRQISVSDTWNCLHFKGIETHHALKKQSLFHWEREAFLLTPGESEWGEGTGIGYQALTTNVTATWKSPNGKHTAFQSFPFSFQDTNYKIPEQRDSWSRYKACAERGERLKAYSWRNWRAITSPVLWFLTLKHLQPKHRLSHLHEEQDIDRRLENSASAYLSKIKPKPFQIILLDSRRNWGNLISPQTAPPWCQGSGNAIQLQSNIEAIN